MSYIYITQNDTPYRIQLCKKSCSETIIDLAWTFNLYNCKKITKQKKTCRSFILISAKYKHQNTDLENFKQLPVQSITVWKKLTGCIVIQNQFHINPESNITLDLLKHKHNLFWIKTWTKQQKCNSCGRIYTSSHKCDYSRSSFYYNQIACSKKFWEPISFQPIGEHENTKKLFLIYDIETFTLTEPQGTTLLPVMLCFSTFGDHTLVKIAEEEIKKDTTIAKEKNTYYWFSKQKNFISIQFRKLRENILTALVSHFLEYILTPENKEILQDYANTQNITNILEINVSDNKDLILSLQVKPIFLEFYIIGHNIQSFDEILLATQILQPENFTFSPFLTVSRNFMPRQGRILFNDITISFPYPDFYVDKEEKTDHSQEILISEKEGIPSSHNLKYIYVKSMVRDTFQITHSSLRNAAQAYNLEISKGCCPFKAINDHFSTGKYKMEEQNFPHISYWSSVDEYNEQKYIWSCKLLPEYNIERELLEYCIKDVEVTEQLTKTLLTTFNTFIKEEFNLQCSFNIFKRPTISANSHAIFKQLHFRAHGTKTNKMPDIVAPSEEMYTFIRKSVRGGRCYPSYLGTLEEKIYVYDICGMYASALTHPMPYGIPVGETERNIEIQTLNAKLENTQKLSYFTDIKPMIVSINALPPATELLDCLPPLCSKSSGRLCWTNEPLHDEVVTSVDIVTLHNRGWKVTILPNKLNTVFPSWNTCCTEYVTANISAKEKASKENNPVKRAISKLLSNALYGSFATKEDNDLVTFEHSITEKIKDQLQKKELQITNITTIPTYQMPQDTIQNISYFQRSKSGNIERNYHPDEELNSPFEEDSSSEKATEQTPPSICNVTQYKPFNIVDCTADSLTIYILKSSKEHPTNKRYPTQLASFVLAWTRSFISEWADILFESERDTPIEQKSLLNVYGDTDSLFLTERGHIIMQEKGKHRIKTSKSNLIFNQNKPELTWAAECETYCDICNTPAYSPKSIFVAPKLYALKDITCPNCSNKKGGKVRAKGHAKEEITFEILTECFNYHKSCSNPERKFNTQRRTLKKTLCKSYGSFSPFTIHEINLIRELRPWHDPTMYFINNNVLIPYDLQHQNPRKQKLFLLEEFNDE